MRTTLCKILAALAALGLAAFAQAAGPTGKYRFSPVNQYGINLTAEYWNPIIAYITEKSGVALELTIGRTSADTTSYVLAHEVEFVFSNHLFSPEREKFGWKVFGRRQTPPIHSQIVVPADSPITELAQLQDQEVAFAGPEALVIYKEVSAGDQTQNIPLAFIDTATGLPITPNGGDIIVVWDGGANRIFRP